MSSFTVSRWRTLPIGWLVGLLCLPLALWSGPVVATAAPPAPTAVTAQVVAPRLTGRSQGPAGGYAGLVANSDGSFWGLADTSYGSATQQRAAVVHLDLLQPGWRTTAGGTGQLQVVRTVTLSDPDRRLLLPITDTTPRRVLTGADVDLEGMQRLADGTFWLGDNRRAALLHVDATGRVLRAPVPIVVAPPNRPRSVRGTQGPRSGGIQALAASRDGHHLYPVLADALLGDRVVRRRVVAEFDLDTERLTSRRWDYRVDTGGDLVADAQIDTDGSLLVLEGDDFEGDAAVIKRVYRVDLDRREADGQAPKELVADLLDLDDPTGLSTGGGWGTGTDFSFGLRAADALTLTATGGLVIGSGTSTAPGQARRPGTTDRAELITLDPTATTSAASHTGEVIGHRGASAYRPEHTLASYELAIRQCADYIEPDVVMSADGVPFSLHDIEIGSTTDVAARREFATRHTTKTIGGTRYTGWFVSDFTAAELSTLRARERIPETRPDSARFDGRYPVASLAEVLDLARHSRTCSGRPVGVSPEMKAPLFFSELGLPVPPALVAALRAAGLDRADAPVLVQCFEVEALQQLNQLTDVPLLELLGVRGAPYDLRVHGDPRTFADLSTPTGLRSIARYADAVGLDQDVMIPRTANGYLGAPNPVTADAHAAGLVVIGWTFRRENMFLPMDYRRGTDPNAPGDLAGEIRRFLAIGMDGYYTDNPDIASRVVLG